MPVKTKIKSSTKKGQSQNTFAIVAIGASAGGLEAVTLFLQNLSPTTGMAFVYVQHLSPDHKSILTSLLAKTTQMKVQEVRNKMFMQPDNLYVIPPDKEMIVTDGHIKLTPRTKERVVTLPIDVFFSSLADKHREGAIGIILSGSASDGTQGLAAIKEAGGLTFAQDDSAKFKSMPKSAIAAGAVDFVLSPKEIALELNRLSKHEYMKRRLFGTGKEIENNNPELRIILKQLLKETNVDFSLYKMSTVKRRIYRRMLLNKVKTLKEYVNLIGAKKTEIRILYQDLLINVTTFFRDTSMHQYLKKVLFPQILKTKGPGESLRIWIPACSTGEEVYSIAMTLLELGRTNSSDQPIQIFATDLSAQAIAKARIGEYTSEQLKSVSLARLQRFYTKSGSKYRIAKVLREMCVFATHNILTDPPFSKVDFVSCCNLLIYLDSQAQAKVMKTLHYALKPDGYLMIGRAETIGRSTELFKRVNNKYKIYLRKHRPSKRNQPSLSGHLLRSTINKNAQSNISKNKAATDNGFDRIIDSILLTRAIPASVVVNYSMEILQFRGATDSFLKHSSGKANLNILKMILPEIAFELRYSISKAVKSNQPIRKKGIEVNDGKAKRVVNLEIIPLASEWTEPLLLIIFTDTELVETVLPPTNGAKSKIDSKDRVITRLKKELLETRADMRAFAKEQEVFNEELQNANEEVVSSNEELQSVNEELETSKEEIESTNEELITTNQELETRNELLNESYGYSEAIINTIHEPMLILDKDLRVKSANKSFYRNFQVTEEETERTLLFELGNKQWDIPRLRKLLEEIIPKNTRFHDFAVTHAFKVIGNKTMLLNASRIVQKGHGEQLILLAINDITEHTLLQQKEKELLKKEAIESRSYSTKLEQAVEARTKELEELNATLAEKNSELEKMNSELESFAYVSSHDLQEPLRKIQTFASRILETENQNLSEKGKDYFNRMQNASLRMKRLIEDLLAFSSLNIADRKFENTDLNKIVTEVKVELKETIEEKKAIIEAVELRKVNIIPFQFRQLMYNLINNSLKFAQPNVRPHVVIRSAIVDGKNLNSELFSPNQKYCHISVTDNGIGFDPQYKERIFEVFQKLHGKQEYAGTGIGLAIVKKVVENHNGVISVTSKLNKGATFNIHIPVAD
ncbi:MAG TPA: chemotaxis protein CheB [Cyclobacteriaceae bacterium]|jgi:two-component system CheB/CheR fusion protein|nr:chemotaxis protein CheB [Cyclobacteriaceae bacterium]